MKTNNFQKVPETTLRLLISSITPLKMLNIFNYLAKGTEKPISVLLTLTANSVHVMMLRIPYSEPIFQYGPKFSQNTS